ncbi:META domain-containing protein [Novosphingobium sp. ERN07]|nr:META domain-containing protein [Novosphingobium sp. ERN07]
MRSMFALSLAATAMLGGCATAPSGSAGLAGTHWTIMRIDGAVPAVPEKAAMRFDDARLSANVGCNGIGGDYRVEGGRLLAGPLMATRMFCEGPVWQQEEAVNALLSAAPEMQRSGSTMRLVSGGHALDLQLVRG